MKSDPLNHGALLNGDVEMVSSIPLFRLDVQGVKWKERENFLFNHIYSNSLIQVSFLLCPFNYWLWKMMNMDEYFVGHSKIFVIWKGWKQNEWDWMVMREHVLIPFSDQISWRDLLPLCLRCHEPTFLGHCFSVALFCQSFWKSLKWVLNFDQTSLNWISVY